MNIDNITSDSMTLTYNGKAMLIKVYEQEIERLTLESTKWESKFYDEAKKVDKAIEYIEKELIETDSEELLDILKGVDKE